MNSGVIYKLTNRQTGKIYIGQARDNKQKNNKPYKYGSKGRWCDHISSSATSLTPLAEDIRRYGKESFEVQDLEKAELNHLDALEAKWIEEMDCIVPKGYNVMRHSQNKHREKSNIVSYFKGKTLSATLRKIRRNGEYGLVHCWLMLEDGTKRRVVFGQHNGKTFQEAWSDTLAFVEELNVPFSEDITNSDDPLERYSDKLQEFENAVIKKIRIAKFNSLVAVYITTADAKSWKDQQRICFGGKTITQEFAYSLACLFVEQLQKNTDTILLDTITQSPQQAAASMDGTAP